MYTLVVEPHLISKVFPAIAHNTPTAYVHEFGNVIFFYLFIFKFFVLSSIDNNRLVNLPRKRNRHLNRSIRRWPSLKTTGSRPTHRSFGFFHLIEMTFAGKIINRRAESWHTDLAVSTLILLTRWSRRFIGIHILHMYKLFRLWLAWP